MPLISNIEVSTAEDLCPRWAGDVLTNSSWRFPRVKFQPSAWTPSGPRVLCVGLSLSG